MQVNKKMNEEKKARLLLKKLVKIYPSKNWHIYDFGAGYIYLYYRHHRLIHFTKIASVNAIVKFIIICITDAPEKFDIKQIVCKLKKKKY